MTLLIQRGNNLVVFVKPSPCRPHSIKAEAEEMENVLLLPTLRAVNGQFSGGSGRMLTILGLQMQWSWDSLRKGEHVCSQV